MLVLVSQYDPGSHMALLQGLLVLALLQPTDSACFKNVACSACISEVFDGGSCMWYSPPTLPGIGSCVAGQLGYKPPIPFSGQVATDSYGQWGMTMPDGQNASFSAFDLDRLSEESCYTTSCTYQGQCDVGYWATENKPCYGDDTYPEWRVLKCCRQQRNIDGYLRGFEALSGVIQGQLFYAACCAPCYPGQVNSGCNAYRPGTCEACASGRFNAVGLPGSTCEACQGCPAGQTRQGCGPSTAGRCDACEAGKFKLDAVASAASHLWNAACQACAPCSDGYLRVGCGLSDPGRCVPCSGTSYFASPWCRNCDICLDQAKTRRGCGGLLSGVCTECAPDFWLKSNGVCQACAPCPGSDWVRIGCGASAAGECVRLSAEITVQNASRCPIAMAPDAVCQGATIAMKWTLDGLPSSMLASDFGNCTAAAGLCFAGVWQVSLFHRSPTTVQGEKILDFGELFAEQVGLNVSESSVSSARMMSLVNLPDDLSEASSYFLRVGLTDLGGSCCIHSTMRPFFADAEDFSFPSADEAAEEQFELASDDLFSGRWEDALLRLSSVCSGSSSVSWSACERVKALQLGLPTGQRTLVPSPLLFQAGSASLAAMGALYPVTEAQHSLESWEQLYAVLQRDLPPNESAWALLLLPLATSNSSSANATAQGASPLSALYSHALEASTAAESLASLWQKEVSSSSQQLPQRLADLKELDGLLGHAATAAGFDVVVRMSQAITWQLSDELQAAPAPGAGPEAREAWLSQALQRIGNMAILLMGTWGSTWRHTLEWRLTAEVGNATLWPPAGAASQDFGGAAPPENAVPLADSKKRVWEPFLAVAEAWLKLAEESLGSATATTSEMVTTTVPVATTSMAATTFATTEAVQTTAASGSSGVSTTSTPASAGRRLSGNASNPSGLGNNATRASNWTALPAWQSPQVLTPMIRQVISIVIELTESVLEPMTRTDSLLLEGPLPNISLTNVSGVRGFCLSSAIALFSEDLAVTDAWQGFGVRSVRPWLDPRVEDLRLKQAAREVVSLTWGRARLLDELLVEVADVREVRQEPYLATVDATDAHEAAAHMASLSGSGAAAAWHWRDVWRALSGVAKTGRSSAARLGRRRLSRLERLAAWVGGKLDDGYRSGPANWSWRKPWSPWTPRTGDGDGSAAKMAEASLAASSALEAGIQAKQEYSVLRLQAYLRLEISVTTQPLAFAGLVKTGSSLVRLQAPPGVKGLMMHSEAQAFLLSQASETKPLAASAVSSGHLSASYSSTPHMELRLRRLVGAFGSAGSMEPPVPSGVMPFVTRHERKDCAPMAMPFPEEHTELVEGSLEPLEGLWVLSAVDGPTGNLLIVEETTVLRLLFKVDVPDGAPPWKMLTSSPDVLYKLPSSGNCDELSPIFGSAPQTSTFPPTTRTTTLSLDPPTDPPTTKRSSAPSALTTAVPTAANETAQSFLAPKAEPGGLPAANMTEPWQPPVWLYAFFFVGALGCCCGSVGCYTWWRRRKQKMRLKINPEEEPDKEHDKEVEKEQLQEEGKLDIPAGLRLRLPSPKQSKPESSSEGLEGIPKIRALADASKAQDWGTTDTPRQDGPEATGLSDDEEAKDWSEAATPSGSEGSSRSGSDDSSDYSSGSSSDGGEVQSPRAAMAARAEAAARSTAAAATASGIGESSDETQEKQKVLAQGEEQLAKPRAKDVEDTKPAAQEDQKASEQRPASPSSTSASSNVPEVAQSAAATPASPPPPGPRPALPQLSFSPPPPSEEPPSPAAPPEETPSPAVAPAPLPPSLQSSAEDAPLPPQRAPMPLLPMLLMLPPEAPAPLPPTAASPEPSDGERGPDLA